VLEGIDLAVARGEVVAVVGPSGSGKTTLLRLLNGTLRPTTGSVALEGVDLGALGPRALRRARARVGFVHQDFALVPNLRVSQNVAAGRLGQRGFLAATRSMLWPGARDLAAMHTLLGRVGIEEKLFARTDTLSGGEQQRVAIARALFQEPVALLADEPLASVDPARSRDLMRLFFEIATERGLTMVVSMHDLAVAREFFERMVGLREGRVAFDERTSQIPQARFDELYRLAERTPGDA